MAKKYDDFDEPDSDGIASQILGIVSRHKREFAIVSVSAAVILLGLVVFGGYPDSENDAQNGNVPVVRADAGDYKTAPDNPGGMEIPYRDSTVFSSTTPQKVDGGTENILADESAEQPVPRAQLFAGLNTEGQAAGQPAPAPAPAPDASSLATASNAGMPQMVPPAAAPQADAVINEAIGVQTAVPAATAAQAAPAASVTPPASVASVEPPVVSETPKTATIAPKAPEAPKAAAKKAAEVAKTEPAAGVVASSKGVQPGGYYVQLASVKSQSAASTEWKKFQAKYSALGGLSFRSQEVNLGAKGTFYRIQAGPMSKDSASKVCASVKSAGGTCIVASK